ncbi:MAG: hypothetical protein O6848_05175 [Bacteroidetes bacterium]|nr:hypothetical protein [Bacteroidota bacterium]
MRNYPIYGWVGLGLIGLFWWLNWNLEGLRTHWGFFPLWLGYCLSIDGLVFLRKRDSLIHRNLKIFLGLFVVSAPVWWLFELINARTQYWVYTARDQFSDLEYYSWASLSFSTVIPAIFETTELVSTFNWIKTLSSGPRAGRRPQTVTGFFLSGWLMLAALLIWPQYTAPFMWVSLFFIFDTANYWLGYPSLIAFTREGDWKPVVSLWVASLICGFFWEFWNFYSDPKWLYKIPLVEFWYIFEMPLIGYLGYLPFALEVFALYHLLVSATGIGKSSLHLSLFSY